MAAGSVSGAVSRALSSRAPAPVTVRSITESRLPAVPPSRVAVSSRLRRVAASIAIAAPVSVERSRASRGTRLFWVSLR